MLQAYTKNGDPCGQVARSLAHKEGILHGASHTYICKRENGTVYVLLQRRSENKDSYPGCLDISSAGHIEAGDDHLTTALKELREELGITASPDELTELFTSRFLGESFFRGERFVDNEINKIYLLWSNVSPEKLTLQTSEVSEVLWMPILTVLERVRAKDGELCLTEDELSRVVSKLEERLD